MALRLSSPPSLLTKTPKTQTLFPIPHSLSFSLLHKLPILSSLPFHSTSFKPLSASTSDDFVGGDSPPEITDEWGEKSSPEIEAPPSNLPDADPASDDDEWGGGVPVGPAPAAELPDACVDGSAAAEEEEEEEEEEERGEDEVSGLKRRLVDMVYGTDFGFRTSTETRAEVLEVVTRLEALNPTPAPTGAVEILDGNWVLVYTTFSELLPLLVAGTTPLLKVEFKEGSLQPPEIKSTIDLPKKVDILGQQMDLSPVQQSLNPLQEALASIARAISGGPPLKIPIPGGREKSWLLITYLDKDFRISRGDGGLFVLAKEGSPLLDQ